MRILRGRTSPQANAAVLALRVGDAVGLGHRRRQTRDVQRTRCGVRGSVIDALGSKQCNESSNTLSKQAWWLKRVRASAQTHGANLADFSPSTTTPIRCVIPAPFPFVRMVRLCAMRGALQTGATHFARTRWRRLPQQALRRPGVRRPVGPSLAGMRSAGFPPRFGSSRQRIALRIRLGSIKWCI